MTLNALILKVPDSQNFNAMNEWFTNVQTWATKNNQYDIARDAGSGLFFANHPERVIEFRRKVLSQLKSLQNSSNITLMSLISNVPDSKNTDAICDWFADVNIWAERNNQTDIKNSALSGMFFINYPSRAEEYKNKALEQLKLLKKRKYQEK